MAAPTVPPELKAIVEGAVDGLETIVGYLRARAQFAKLEAGLALDAAKAMPAQFPPEEIQKMETEYKEMCDRVDAIEQRLTARDVSMGRVRAGAP